MGPHLPRGKDNHPGQGNQGGNGQNNGNSDKPHPGKLAPQPNGPDNNTPSSSATSPADSSQTTPLPPPVASVIPASPPPPQPTPAVQSSSIPSQFNPPSGTPFPSPSPTDGSNTIQSTPTTVGLVSTFTGDQVSPSVASSPDTSTLDAPSSNVIAGVAVDTSSSPPSLYQNPGTSQSTGTISPTPTSTINNGFSIPSHMASTQTANHNKPIVAAIVIPILFLFALSVLGCIYFIRRRRPREDASHLMSADSDLEESMGEMQFAGSTQGSLAFTSGGAIMASSIPIAEPSLPNPFASPSTSPSQDSMQQAVRPGSLDYASSQTSRDVETPHTLTEGHWTQLSPVPSLASQSSNVPFFHRLRTLRRLGDLHKQPTFVAATNNVEHTEGLAPAAPKDAGLEHSRYSQRSYDSDDVKTVYAI